jgi:hypothetical protein
MTVVSPFHARTMIDGLSADAGRICFLGCLVNIARHLHVPLTEELLLGAGIGQRFRFGRVRALDPQRQRDIDATIEIHSCDLHLDGDRLTRFCLRRGLRIDKWTYRHAQELSPLVSREITEGRPVLLLVNSAHLPYWPADSRANNGHYLVCYGWAPEQRVAAVLDSFIPSSRQPVYMGKLPIEALRQALDCEGFIGVPHAAAWTFTPLDSYDELTADEVLGTLRESAREMLDGRAETISYGGLEVDFRMGLPGIDALHGELDRAREIFPLISSFGGPARARAVLGDFLSGTAAKLGIPMDAQIVAECAVLSRSWKTFANLVLKSAYGGDAAVGARVSRHLDDIRRREHELAVQIARAAS